MLNRQSAVGTREPMQKAASLDGPVSFQGVESSEGTIRKQRIRVKEQEPLTRCLLGSGVHLRRAALGCGDQPEPCLTTDNFTSLINTPAVHNNDLVLPRLVEQAAKRLR
jgi:hypothetical protein